MEMIIAYGKLAGDRDGCVVCHGGDRDATVKEDAHTGDAFYPDPGSPWINANTCGQCHPKQVGVQWQSLMMTEAGKIQGTTWAFGMEGAENHRWGNYAVENPSDPARRLGTDSYREYMECLREREGQVFVDSHDPLPDAPSDLSELAVQPELAAFTYLRNQCQRCHHGVKGRQVRGDYRGMGCSSCHIPYGNEGFYEGDDPSIPRDEPGHALVHTIQGTRDATVRVGETEYSGIPVETCTTCHDRGKRIGVSFQGLMESEYTSPYTEEGEGQPGLHTKHYLALHQDIHGQKGMVCQDCHTSHDVHGDGFLGAATLAGVEIECSDCHGTVQAYPWELPFGFGDEIAGILDDSPRKTASGLQERMEYLEEGYAADPEDGYLFSSRGNPMPNVVRRDNQVVLYTAGGEDLVLTPLKQHADDESFSLAGKVAMQRVRGHLAKMECYACHSAWAPQCYGCHARIDYSNGATGQDWLAGGRMHEDPQYAADRGESAYAATLAGRVQEQRSYMRWEYPSMGVNGEGRVTPVAPGCQVSVTIIGEDGEPILLNHIFHAPSEEGFGPARPLALDMSPLQPHTMTGEVRSCESCHASEKALGYGIAGGRLMRDPSLGVTVDLQTASGEILPAQRLVQMAAIENLEADWSRFVTEDDQQLQTVGHHFSKSRALNSEERAHMEREGICLSCHQEIPDGSLAVSVMHHIAERTGQMPVTNDQHGALIHKTLLFAGWGQLILAAGGGAFGFFCLVVVFWLWQRRRRRRKVKKADSADT